MVWTWQLGPWSLDLPLSSYRSGAPHVPMRARYLGMASTGPDPLGGPAPPRVGGRPLWACLSSWPRGPGPPLFPPGRGPAPHVPPRCRLQGRPCHVPVADGPPRDASPSQSMVCPTDTTVSPLVTKAARHYALRAGRRRLVTSRCRARE
jgi:hypothetical protein